MISTLNLIFKQFKEQPNCHSKIPPITLYLLIFPKKREGIRTSPYSHTFGNDFFIFYSWITIVSHFYGLLREFSIKSIQAVSQ
jgi:hypothetical protein